MSRVGVDWCGEGAWRAAGRRKRARLVGVGTVCRGWDEIEKVEFLGEVLEGGT